MGGGLMITAAADVMSAVTELVFGAVGTMGDWFIELGDGIASLIGLPPRRGSWRWLESAEGIAERREWERIKAARAEWEMIPDRIEIGGQFTNLPEGTTAADLAHWSADGLADKLQDFGSSFYVMRTVPYYAGAVISADPAEPSVMVRCQYCQVGGQDPDDGVCGRCGAPFPPAPALMVPSRLGNRPAQDPEYQFTYDADGHVTGVSKLPVVNPASIGYSVR